MNKSNLDEITTQDLFEFLQDNMVVKIEFNERIASIESRMATKDDLAALESRMATKDDLAALESRMVSKAYLDDKLADLGAEIGARINRRVERDQEFKRGILNLLKRHALAGAEEFAQLEAYI